MKVTEAKYTRRFTTGQYEFEEHTLSCTSGEDENEKGSELLLELKKEVLEAHAGIKISNEETKEELKKEKKNGKSKTNNAKNSNEDGEDSTSEDSGNDGESYKDDASSDPKASDDDSNNAESGEESAEGEDSEEKVPAKGKRGKASKEPKEEKSEKGKKSFRAKPQHYDRSIEAHKDIFKVSLESVAPDWKKNEESKRKAKKASENLEGDEFLDENGEVVPEFITKIRKLMK